MTLKDIGHNRMVTATRHGYTVEGLLVWSRGRRIDDDSNWYLLTNSANWQGDDCLFRLGTDYKYSWVMVSTEYDSVSPLEAMLIRKNIIKHKMIGMT